jgi:hypothetical protein
MRIARSSQLSRVLSPPLQDRICGLSGNVGYTVIEDNNLMDSKHGRSTAFSDGLPAPGGPSEDAFEIANFELSKPNARVF